MGSFGVCQIIQDSGCGTCKNGVREFVHDLRVAIGQHQTSAGSCQSLSNTESQTLGRTRDQNRAMFQIHVQVKLGPRPATRFAE